MITFLRRLGSATVLIVAVVLGAIVVLAADAIPAGAAALQEPSGDGPVGSTLTLNATVVNILIGVVLPILLGIALKPSNPQWVKTIGGIVVAGVAAVITNAIRDDGTAVLSAAMFLQFVTVYVPQIVSYLGLWKPLGEDTAAGSFDGALGPGVVPFEKRPAAAGASD
jgi:hypothetical protein